MGFEPTTPTLARLCSTPELHPLVQSHKPLHQTMCIGKSLRWIRITFFVLADTKTQSSPKTSMSILLRNQGLHSIACVGVIGCVPHRRLPCRSD